MDKFFKAKNGRVVIWQTPNIPLWGWIICRVLGLVIKDGSVGTGLSKLGTSFLFAWALLELLKGESYFRRVVGALVLAAISLSFFK
jgi:hypothetical protein